MPRGRLPYLILPIAALLCVLPLILQGPSCGHDFDFHLLNWFEAAAQFRHGNLHPQWAVSPAFNAGEPRFLFYPPLSWTIGAILGLVFPWTVTPILYTWLALTAAGLTLHRLARQFASPAASLIASTLYLANPYMLFTAYERTAYAELLAAAWFPLLFLAILKPRPTIPSIALPLALLWLTNAPAAVMGTYTLAVLALLRLLLERTHLASSSDPAQNASSRPEPPNIPSSRPKRSEVERPPYFAPPPGHEALPTTRTLALTTASGTILGLSLAAFYILPAALERKYVQIAMVVLPGMRIEDNTLFHHTGFSEDALFHDFVLRTASIVAILLLAATAAALLTARKKSETIPLAIFTALIALLLTPISLPLWHHLPELAFLQFPWRLLAILATILALAAALGLDRLTLKPLPLVLSALTLTTALILPAIQNFRQLCDAPDTVPARLTLFQTHAGSEPTDEYTPEAADNDSLGQYDPPYWLSPDPDAPPPSNATPGPAPLDLALTSPIPQTLILHLREYPDWHTDLNGGPAPPSTPRADGLLNLPIPAGPSRIHITWSTSRLEQAADALSTIALLTLLYLALRPEKLDRTGKIKLWG